MASDPPGRSGGICSSWLLEYSVQSTLLREHRLHYHVGILSQGSNLSSILGTQWQRFVSESLLAMHRASKCVQGTKWAGMWLNQRCFLSIHDAMGSARHYTRLCGSGIHLYFQNLGNRCRKIRNSRSFTATKHPPHTHCNQKEKRKSNTILKYRQRKRLDLINHI